MNIIEFKSMGELDIGMAESKVSAGFPSPAADFMENGLDLNRLLIDNAVSTFFVRVEGESMIDAGINPDDILIVDRAVPPLNGNIVIAAVDGEMTVKRLRLSGSKVRLVPENPDFDIIEITQEIDFSIWGVVTACVHSFKGR